MIETASIIAVIVAFLCLVALVYLALFMPGKRDQDEPRDLKRDIDRMQNHYTRWEDRL